MTRFRRFGIDLKRQAVNVEFSVRVHSATGARCEVEQQLFDLVAVRIDYSRAAELRCHLTSIPENARQLTLYFADQFVEVLPP